MTIGQNGVITLTNGNISASGSVINSGGNVDVLSGSLFAAAYQEVGGNLTIGTLGTLGVAVGGALTITGGATVYDAGTIQASSLEVDSSTFTLTSTLNLTGSLTMLGSLATIAQGASASAASVSLGAISESPNLTLAGTLNDLGDLTSVNGTGSVYLQPGGKLDIAGSVSNESISFNGGGFLNLETTDQEVLQRGFSMAIFNFGVGSTIEFSGVAYDPGYSVYTGNGDLEIIKASNSPFEPPQFVADIERFQANTPIGLVDDDGSVAVVALCFLAGTLISTVDGERTIESLRVGDHVLTAEGTECPIRWLGRQTVMTRFADRARVAPIRIVAGALGEMLPIRDLYVSADHALMVDGVFAQAGALVNGLTITREDREMPDTFIYYHVELSDHSLILAEGVPAETFIDNVDRLAFDNWADHDVPAEAPPLVEMTHPRAKSHRQLPRDLRDRLVARARALHVSHEADAA